MRQACRGKVLGLWHCNLCRLLCGMLRRFFLRSVLRLPPDDFLCEEVSAERALPISTVFWLFS